MCRDFTYADFCCVDAAILDADSLKKLQEITLDIEATHSPAERVALRAARIAMFLDYLVRCDERWVVEAKRRELGEEWQQQVVKSVLQQAVLKDDPPGALPACPQLSERRVPLRTMAHRARRRRELHYACQHGG
jgi:hypothetical protein